MTRNPPHPSSSRRDEGGKYSRFVSGAELGAAQIQVGDVKEQLRTVHVHGTDLETKTILCGSFHLIDLAGNERVARSEVKGDRLQETKCINRSLSTLGDVIFVLARKNAYVPYRNSKLTQLLQGSLAKTIMFVQNNPYVLSYSETVSTLKFAERVSGVELGAAQIQKEGGDVKEQVQPNQQNHLQAASSQLSSMKSSPKVADSDTRKPIVDQRCYCMNNVLCIMLGDLELKNDDWVKAKETFRTAKNSTDAKDSYAAVCLGNWNYFAANRNEKRVPNLEATQYEKAKELYTKVLLLQSANLYAANCAGMVFAEKGQFDIAKALFTQVQKPDVWINVAHVHFAQGNFALVVNLYQVLLYLARTHYEAEQWQE
ncbi:hypothetical protein OROMI_032604 [Orobanche minor]